MGNSFQNVESWQQVVSCSCQGTPSDKDDALLLLKSETPSNRQSMNLEQKQFKKKKTQSQNNSKRVNPQINLKLPKSEFSGSQNQHSDLVSFGFPNLKEKSLSMMGMSVYEISKEKNNSPIVQKDQLILPFVSPFESKNAELNGLLCSKNEDQDKLKSKRRDFPDEKNEVDAAQLNQNSQSYEKSKSKSEINRKIIEKKYPSEFQSGSPSLNNHLKRKSSADSLPRRLDISARLAASHSSSKSKSKRWALAFHTKNNNKINLPVNTIQLMIDVVSFDSTDSWIDVFSIGEYNVDRNIISSGNPKSREKIQGIQQRRVFGSFQNEQKNKCKLKLYCVSRMKYSKKESTYFLRQASIFMGLKNIELVATKLYKMFMSRNQFFFVYEQPTETHMTLTEYLLSLKDPLSTTLIKKFAQYLLKCLQMCHNKEIAHLDLQPDHILIFQTKEDMNESIHSAHADYSSPQNFNEEIIRLHDDSSEFIRLSNFFMSGGLDHKKFSHNKMSSLHFMAPERILGTVDLKDQAMLAKCDTWSVGVLLYLLVTGDLPFKGRHVTRLVKKIKKGKPQTSLESFEELDQELQDLITQLLEVDPVKRLNCVQALNHPFLTNWEEENKKMSEEGLNNIKQTLAEIQMQDQLKTEINFYDATVILDKNIDEIFANVTVLKPCQIVNALSHLTDDNHISQFIFDSVFSEDMKNNETQVTNETICEIKDKFWDFYKMQIQRQLHKNLHYISQMPNQAKAIKLVKQQMCFVLKQKELDPQLASLDILHLQNILFENFEKNQRD